MDLIKFTSNMIVPDRFYGGNAGAKRAYLYDNKVWLVKFPESTEGFKGKHLPSYTTNALSEYIGSHVYESLGIPVHETSLGVCDDKVVVACKDFSIGKTLIEFNKIKNTADEEYITGSHGSSAMGESLNNVLSVIKHVPAFDGIRNEVLARFWDMFIVDALIFNNDRNNGNWGLLSDGYTFKLAPVYDNGNAFFNKRNASMAERRLQERALLEQDVKVNVSFFLNEEGKHIHPLDFIASGGNKLCNEALVRIVNKIEQGAFEEIKTVINNIPKEIDGLKVIDPAQKEHYIAVMEIVVNETFLPTVENLLGKVRTEPKPKRPSPAELAASAKAEAKRFNEGLGNNTGNPSHGAR